MIKIIDAIEIEARKRRAKKHEVNITIQGATSEFGEGMLLNIKGLEVFLTRTLCDEISRYTETAYSMMWTLGMNPTSLIENHEMYKDPLSFNMNPPKNKPSLIPSYIKYPQGLSTRNLRDGKKRKKKDFIEKISSLEAAQEMYTKHIREMNRKSFEVKESYLLGKIGAKKGEVKTKKDLANYGFKCDQCGIFNSASEAVQVSAPLKFNKTSTKDKVDEVTQRIGLICEKCAGIPDWKAGGMFNESRKI